MIFADPIPFQEAIDSRRAKRLLPTDLSSEQLAALPPELREWASFSAAVAKAEHLQEFDNLTARIAGGATPEDFARRAAGEGSLLTNLPQARAQIRGYLRSVGYKAKPGEEGTIKDLSSDVRINLKLRTDVALAQGSGQYTAGQTPATLDLIPCQELIRVSRRKVPRKWPAIWKRAGGKFYGGGRMIAAKDDPIWCRISRFGVPYAPFDYNSGMGLRGVRRKEAVALGVIPEDYRVTPQPRPLPQGQAGAAYFDAALIEAMHQAGYVLKDGVLTTANYRADQMRVPKGQAGGGRFVKETHFSPHKMYGGQAKESAHLSAKREAAVLAHLQKHFAAGVSPDAALASWHQSLKVANPVQASSLVTWGKGKFTKAQKAAVLAGIQHWLDIAPPAATKNLRPFTVQKGKGSHWNNAADVMQLNSAHVNAGLAHSHVLHETMHAIHLNAPDSYKATIARHFRVRTDGEAIHPLPNLNAAGKTDVVGKEDQWLKEPDHNLAYAGRIYDPEEPGVGTEVPTVYGQHMGYGVHAAHAMQHDPQTLAKVLSIFYHGRRLPQPPQGGTP